MAEKLGKYAFDYAFQELWYNTLDLLKECLETDCINLGDTVNEFEYINWLKGDPLQFNGYGAGFDTTFGELSIDMLDQSSFDAYSTKSYNIMKQLRSRMRSLSKLESLMPADFRIKVIDYARRNNLPPILFMYICLSEGSFHDSPTNKEGYGGYFGQKTADGIGYGAPFEIQADAKIGKTYRAHLNRGTPMMDAIALTYVSHHLPVIGNYIWNDTGGRPWRTNANELAMLLTEVYNRRMSKPMSSTRLAEAMMINLYAQCAVSYISKAPELQKYF